MSHFEPSRARGNSLRHAMDAALWASSSDLLGCGERNEPIDRRASPVDYAAYSDLVLTIPEWQRVGDDLRDEARAHLRHRLDDTAETHVGSDAAIPRIRSYTEKDYSPIQLDRLARWSSTEEANWLGLAAASHAEQARVTAEILRALRYLEQADADLFGEICAIVDSIVIVTPDRKRKFEFTAGTSFATWGAIVANGDLLQDWIECYNMLAHEEGHLALFAIARDEPLVLNATDPVYASPVRDDPRPIDGIYHTAFVAAREARAHDRLLEWHEQTGALSDSDAKLVSESLEVSVISFWQSFEVLEKFAEYSSLGSAIMDELRDYMSMRFTVLTE